MSKKLMALKLKARERDNHICQDCGKAPGLFFGQVHHIDKNRDNNVLENLVTLCTKCHGERHTGEERIKPDRICDNVSLIRVDYAGRVTLPKYLLEAIGVDMKHACNAVLLVEAYPSLENAKTLIMKKGRA